VALLGGENNCFFVCNQGGFRHLAGIRKRAHPGYLRADGVFCPCPLPGDGGGGIRRFLRGVFPGRAGNKKFGFREFSSDFGLLLPSGFWYSVVSIFYSALVDGIVVLAGFWRCCALLAGKWIGGRRKLAAMGRPNFVPGPRGVGAGKDRGGVGRAPGMGYPAQTGVFCTVGDFFLLPALLKNFTGSGQARYGIGRQNMCFLVGGILARQLLAWAGGGFLCVFYPTGALKNEARKRWPAKKSRGEGSFSFFLGRIFFLCNFHSRYLFEAEWPTQEPAQKDGFMKFPLLTNGWDSILWGPLGGGKNNGCDVFLAAGVF